MLGRKLNVYMLHKKKTLITKIKQKHFTDMFMLLNTATKPGAINGPKSNFILTFLLEGCLVN